MTKMHNVKKMTLSALYIALGYVLPFFTGQIPTIGKMLLPMHIPVLLCGFSCGWQYGLIAGIILPIFRSIVAGMPILMPTAIGMAFELGTYGLLSGLMYSRLPSKPLYIYFTLICSMIGGRIVWGCVSIFLYGIQGNTFSWKLFAGGAFLNALPGIMIQLIVIPIAVILLQRAGMIEKQSEYE